MQRLEKAAEAKVAVNEKASELTEAATDIAVTPAAPDVQHHHTAMHQQLMLNVKGVMVQMVRQKHLGNQQ